MTTEVKNMEELTGVAARYLHELETGTIPIKQAAELFNGIGKIIGIQKARIEYYDLRNEAPDMPFMGKPGKPLK